MRWLFLGAVGTRWNSARLRWSPHAQWEDGHFSEGEVGKFAFRLFFFLRLLYGVACRLLYGDFCTERHSDFCTVMFFRFPKPHADRHLLVAEVSTFSECPHCAFWCNGNYIVCFLYGERRISELLKTIFFSLEF